MYISDTIPSRGVSWYRSNRGMEREAAMGYDKHGGNSMSKFRDFSKTCKYRYGTVPFPKDAEIVSILPAFPPVDFDAKHFTETARLTRCNSPNRKKDNCNSSCPEILEE